MRLGVLILTDRCWRDGADRWRQAEQLGFDSAWTYDHLWWRALGDGPWYSTVPVLSAAAAITDRITLGVLVTTPNFRHPVLVAKDAMTIDDVSGGRLVLGLGAGSPGAGDADVLGGPVLSARGRADRFEEFVGLTDRLLRTPDRPTDHEGRWFQARGARMAPGCVQRPRVPLAIAATGRRGLRLAAERGRERGDAWVTLGPPDPTAVPELDDCVAVVADQVRRLRQACEDAGRDPDTIERIYVSTGQAGDPLRSAACCREIAERYAAVGITQLVLHWPRESGVYAGDPRVLAEIAAEVLPTVHRL